MYNDGLRHENLRRPLLQTLNSYTFPKRSEVQSYLSEALSSDVIDESVLHECVTHWHSKFFGLEYESVFSLIELTEPLISLVVFRDYSAIENVSAALDSIDSFFREATFNKDGLIWLLLQQGVDRSTISNLVIDSHLPMLAGASSVLYFRAKEGVRDDETKKERRSYVMRILTELPPFRYMGRLSTLGSEEHIVQLDLRECHSHISEQRSSSKLSPLTFGLGSHACPGASHAMIFFDDLISIFGERYRSKRFRVHGTVDRDSHICSIINFRIESDSRFAS